MIKFIKHVDISGDKTITVYLPLHSCNLLSFTHISMLEKKKVEDSEEEVETLKEILHIEENILEEHTYNVPLRNMRRIKQTKSEEVFQTEEVVKVMEPRIKSFSKKEEISKILTFLDENSI